MDANSISTILKIGENIAVEFKRCGNGIENDVYETICSFLNRFGGDLCMWRSRKSSSRYDKKLY